MSIKTRIEKLGQKMIPTNLNVASHTIPYTFGLDVGDEVKELIIKEYYEHTGFNPGEYDLVIHRVFVDKGRKGWYQGRKDELEK
jgi:hypothetical protein